MSKPAVIYARVSSDRQREQDTIASQIAALQAYAAAHDYVVGDAVHPDEAEHLWRHVDPAQSHLQGLAPGEVIIFTQSTLPDAERYQQHHPDVRQVEQRYNRFGEEIMRVYGSSEEVPAEPSEEAPALDA